ncbi:MAG: DUF3617 family protein [Nitrospirae bacterium]|nr:DUF3617 family protein [Nitrospirota bacterium]
MQSKRFCIVMSAVFISIVLSLPVALFADVNIAEGEWETTTEIKMEGAPFQMPQTKMTYCVTKGDLVPKTSEEDKKCDVKEQKVVGNKVTWKIYCTEKNSTTEGEGEITYEGNNYKGTIRTRYTEKGEKPMTSTILLTGRRIGECKKKGETVYKFGDQSVTLSESDLKKAQEEAKLAEQKQKELQRKGKEQQHRAEELFRLPVPTADAGACVLKDWKIENPECDSKFGKLNIQIGEWEFTEERAHKFTSKDSKVQPLYQLEGVNKSAGCITEEQPSALTAITGTGECIKEQKRNRNKITWKYKCVYNAVGGSFTDEANGGIVYNGNSYEGIIAKKTLHATGDVSTSVIKLSGKRLGDGQCIGRDYTAKGRGYTSKGRDYTAQPRENITDKAKDKVDKIKKLFGW